MANSKDSKKYSRKQLVLKRLLTFDFDYQYDSLYDAIMACVYLNMDMADLSHCKVFIGAYDILMSALSAYRCELFERVEILKRVSALEEKEDADC